MSTKRTRVFRILATVLVSLPIMAVLLPDLAIFALALLALVVPVLVMLAPAAVWALGYWLTRGNPDRRSDKRRYVSRPARVDVARAIVATSVVATSVVAASTQAP
jgi:hypothetical protein